MVGRSVSDPHSIKYEATQSIGGQPVGSRSRQWDANPPTPIVFLAAPTSKAYSIQIPVNASRYQPVDHQPGQDAASRLLDRLKSALSDRYAIEEE